LVKGSPMNAPILSRLADRNGTHAHSEAVRLREWHEKVHVMHVAHSKAAARDDRLNRGLGVAVAILTTFTGSTVFTSLNGSTTQGVKIAAVITSIVAVLLAAAHTALGFGKLSGAHQQAAVSYGELRRDMEKWC